MCVCVCVCVRDTGRQIDKKKMQYTLTDTDIGVLLLVFNATVACPTMISLFPDYAVRHYNYLRDTIPHLVPKLQVSMLIFNSFTFFSIHSPKTFNLMWIASCSAKPSRKLL